MIKREDLPDFRVWTTPLFKIRVKPSGKLVDIKEIKVSFSQDGQRVHLSGDDVTVEPESDMIFVKMTQEQSGKFHGDQPVHVEVNILYTDENRYASKWKHVWATPNLYEKEM